MATLFPFQYKRQCQRSFNNSIGILPNLLLKVFSSSKKKHNDGGGDDDDDNGDDDDNDDDADDDGDNNNRTNLCRFLQALGNWSFVVNFLLH